MPDLSNVPGWGMFAIAIVFMGFQFAERITKRKRLSNPPPPPPQDLATAIRDLDDRKKVFDTLTSHDQLLTRLAISEEKQTDTLAVQTEILRQVVGKVERVGERVEDLHAKVPFPPLQAAE